MFDFVEVLTMKQFYDLKNNIPFGEGSLANTHLSRINGRLYIKDTRAALISNTV